METVSVQAAEWSERAATLKNEGWMVADLCGVDRYSLPEAGARFEVVVTLLHLERKDRLRVHVLASGDPPTVPSITALWATANFLEREAYDMFGINFEGHPNLTRILMPEDWEGYPLRKDYGVGKVPVEFVEQPFLQIDAPGQRPNVDEAGDEIDELGQIRARPAREPGP